MSQRKSQIPNSSLPPSQRSDTFFQIPEITAGNFEDELEAAVTLEDHELVLEILDKAPNFYKKKVEYSLLRATSLMSLGQSDQALDLLLKLEKTQQNYLPLYLPLAFICMENDWPGSALRAALRVRKSRAIDPETQELVENIISEATSMITAEAKNESLPFEKMQRATIQNEKAQIAFAKHRFSEVIHFTKEAIKIAPNWTPPQNNLAQALFFSGKVNEAIQITENVLAQDPDNLFALEKMVIYLFGAGNINRASEYAARFAAFSDDFEVDSDEMKRLISILALVEDTSSLWKLAQRFADEDATSLSVRTWHILAVSAARTGEMSVAIKLMEKIDKEIIRKSEILFLDDLRRVNAQPKSSLKWLPPFYPNLEIYLIPPIIAELEAIFDNAPEEMTAVAQKKLDNLFIKYPFLMPVIKLAILNSETNDFACTILVNLLSFNEDEELYRFAFSQTGSLSARMNVLKILFQHDRYTGPNLVRLWDESIQDWCEVKLVFQKIVKSFI
ncbi:MAG: hypothetical protein BGO78_07495 [Chloroflexi bacterium 44-23]|nr:MAG: hypothetical protein BGO78_07495 [Chloroflexi bacterium 44-23]